MAGCRWARRIALAAALVLALLSAGCAQPKASGKAPRWDAGAVRRGAPGLLVLRSAEASSAPDELHLVSLDGKQDVKVWSGDPRFDALLIAVDRSRVAVALRRRGASDTVVEQTGPGSFSGHSQSVEQYVLVLSSDGTVSRSAVPTPSPDIVSSAAFAGPDLLLASSGPVFHYPGPGKALVLRDGTIRPLAVDRHGVQGAIWRLMALRDGRVAATFGTGGPGVGFDQFRLLEYSAGKASAVGAGVAIPAGGRVSVGSLYPGPQAEGVVGIDSMYYSAASGSVAVLTMASVDSSGVANWRVQPKDFSAIGPLGFGPGETELAARPATMPSPAPQPSALGFPARLYTVAVPGGETTPTVITLRFGRRRLPERSPLAGWVGDMPVAVGDSWLWVDRFGE